MILIEDLLRSRKALGLTYLFYSSIYYKIYFIDTINWTAVAGFDIDLKENINLQVAIGDIKLRTTDLFFSNVFLWP